MRMVMLACLLVLLVTDWSSACSRSTSLQTLDGNCPRVISREEWGARPPTEPSDSIPNDRPYVFVHHTAMAACNNTQSCTQAVKQVQDLHMDGNGWWDIGYSFLIGGDGSIFEGRGWNVQGAHTGGFNTVGYGICFLGDFTNEAVSFKATQAYHDLVFCGRDMKKVSATFQMFGHRQTKVTGATECPGDTLFETIQTWPRWTDCTVEEENCLDRT